MANDQNSKFPFWIIFLIIGIIVIIIIIVLLVLLLKKKDRIPTSPNYSLVVTNNNEITVSWDKNDPNLHDLDNINIFATMNLPIIVKGIVTNSDVIASNPIKAKENTSIILGGLDKFENMQIYITITITGDDINTHTNNIYLVYMSIYPPSSNEMFQLEPVGIDGNIDFDTNRTTDPAIVNLVSSSTTKTNNYYTFNNTSGEGSGTFSNQLVTIVNSSGEDMGPWVLKRNGNKLQAVPRETVTVLDMANTQWTYINNHWCIMSDPTSCILVDDTSHLPSTISVGKVNNDPREIKQNNVYLGQRWKNIVKQ